VVCHTVKFAVLTVVCAVAVLGLEALWSAAAARQCSLIGNRFVIGPERRHCVEDGFEAYFSTVWGVVQGKADGRWGATPGLRLSVVVTDPERVLPKGIVDRTRDGRDPFDWIEIGPFLPSAAFDQTNDQLFALRPERFCSKGMIATAGVVLLSRVSARRSMTTAHGANRSRRRITIALCAVAALLTGCFYVLGSVTPGGTILHDMYSLNYDGEPRWAPRFLHRAEAVVARNVDVNWGWSVTFDEHLDDWADIVIRCDRLYAPANPSHFERISLRGFGFGRPVLLTATYGGKTEYGISWRGVAWNLIALAGLGCFVWFAARVTIDIRRGRRLRRGQCPKCAYPSPHGRCTECGWAAPA